MPAISGKTVGSTQEAIVVNLEGLDWSDVQTLSSS